MPLGIVCMVSKLNADDIRRIQIELLFDLELVTAEELSKINFIDEVSKAEIINRKLNIVAAVIPLP